MYFIVLFSVCFAYLDVQLYKSLSYNKRLILTEFCKTCAVHILLVI